MRRIWTPSRRRLMACAGGLVVGIAGLVGPAQAQAQAQTMTEVTFVVVNNLFSTPAFVAVENGYWTKQGLNVKIKLTSSGRQVTQSLQAGEAQFGHAALSTTTAAARASGNMLKGVMPYYNAGDFVAKAGGRAIIARKDRGIDVVTECTEKGGVRVSVADAGPGVPRQLGDNIFHPFVTTKRDGLGVGLAISRTIVQSYGGSLVYRDNPAGGAIFVVELPPEESTL